MRKSVFTKWLSRVLCLALLAAVALSTVSFAETAPAETEDVVILLTGTQEEPTLLGEGAKSFLFDVQYEEEDLDAWFLISTDAETVGAALLENGLVAGSESEYGLYVTSVLDIEIIYTEDNPHYWAFYVDGEYAQTGVDATPIEDGKIYLFKAE